MESQQLHIWNTQVNFLSPYSMQSCIERLMVLSDKSIDTIWSSRLTIQLYESDQENLNFGIFQNIGRNLTIQIYGNLSLHETQSTLVTAQSSLHKVSRMLLIALLSTHVFISLYLQFYIFTFPAAFIIYFIVLHSIASQKKLLRVVINALTN